jgi:hypothetical protein
MEITFIPLSLEIALSGLSDLKVRKTFKKPILVFELLSKNPQFNNDTLNIYLNDNNNIKII